MLLFGASLVGASLVGTDFAGARLRNANLAGTDLSAVRNLTQARLAGTRLDSTTVLPPGLSRPPADFREAVSVTREKGDERLPWPPRLPERLLLLLRPPWRTGCT